MIPLKYVFLMEWKYQRMKTIKGDKYCWPFIDLFTYEVGAGIHSCGEFVDVLIDNEKQTKLFKPFGGHPNCSNNFRFFGKEKISFFHNEWNLTEFFPLNKVNFFVCVEFHITVNFTFLNTKLIVISFEIKCKIRISKPLSYI